MIFFKIIRRTIALAVIGLILNNGYDLENWRIPGTLQRFALTYFSVASAVAFFPQFDCIPQDSDQVSLIGSEHTQSEDVPKKRSKSIRLLQQLNDIVPYSIQWIFVLLFPLIHSILTFVIGLPGCPIGYVGPGGRGDQGNYPDCTGGFARWIDLKVFGDNHIYQNPSCQGVFDTGSYDPEGILGNLNNIVQLLQEPD